MKSDDSAISLKLLAHINNDAHLAGSRSLQGELFKNTVHFLQEFISRSNLLEPEKAKIFFEKLEKMVGLIEGQSALKNELVNSTEEKREAIYLDYTKETAKAIVEGESILFPGGWSGFPGHAMVYQFDKDKEGNIRFLVYNSGDGLQYHMEDESSRDRNRRLSVKAYTIPKEVTEEEIQAFLVELTKPTVESHLPNREIRKIRVYNAKRLYTEVIPKIHCLGGYETYPKDIGLGDIVTIGQRSGTCAEKSLHQLIKGEIHEPKKIGIFQGSCRVARYHTKLCDS